MKSKRLYLRAPEINDAMKIYIWENDTNIWKVSNTYAPYSHYNIVEYIKQCNDIVLNKQLKLLICLNSNNDSIGMVDLFDLNFIHKRACTGIMISNEYRGNKYAKEAMEILIDYAFNNLMLKQLYCDISSNNTISINIFESLNFVKTGIKKQWLYDNNKWEDIFFYQLIN